MGAPWSLHLRHRRSTKVLECGAFSGTAQDGKGVFFWMVSYPTSPYLPAAGQQAGLQVPVWREQNPSPPHPTPPPPPMPLGKTEGIHNVPHQAGREEICPQARHPLHVASSSQETEHQEGLEPEAPKASGRAQRRERNEGRQTRALSPAEPRWAPLSRDRAQWRGQACLAESSMFTGFACFTGSEPASH